MTRASSTRLPVVGAVFAVASVVMVVLERPLRAGGGPGIVALEVADPERAAEILAAWGPERVPAARRLVWADFGYMPTYAALAWLLVGRRRGRAPSSGPRRRGGRVAQVLPLVALAGDAVEGVGLLSTLGGASRSEDPRPAVVTVTRAAASVKFAALAAAAGWVIATRAGGTPGRDPAR